MDMRYNNKLLKIIILNIAIYIVLYNIPIQSKILENLCIFKNITGKECWNCGMTRAFLSIIQFNFKQAYEFNKNVIIVFPLALGIYINTIYKYIKKGDVKK